MIAFKVGDTNVNLDLFIADSSGPKTGESPTCAVRRMSDDQILDWNDNTFKASGWTTKLSSMTDMNGVDTDLAGHYRKAWDSSSPVTAAGEYQFIFKWNDGSNDLYAADDIIFEVTPAAVADVPTAAQNADAVWDEAVSGHQTAATFGEELHKTKAVAVNRQELADGSSSNLVTYDNDGVTPLITQDVTDKSNAAISSDSQVPAKRGAP